ncbi:hypothetical protein PIB30_060803 [Stylosanthes scabra]|uniref:Uncharacterized protein n=1 Tax=Stylosanthes scabra TaxID=79078 RepID=A0ABU6XII0_9FABA|nr:hypothetical protein [Stylosanthes scabra]
MPYVDGVAAIRKKHENPEDYVHHWLCMDSIHATYKPIERPKVHARKRDPVEVLIEGDKLKKTFSVTCSKCGEKDHNYKTCKGAPKNPNPKPSTRKKKRGESSTQNAPTVVQVSQSAPQLEAEGVGDSQQEQPGAINQNEVGNDEPIITDYEGPSKRFRAKQQIRKRTSKRLVSASQQENPIPTEAMEPPKSPVASPSKETLAAAGPAAQRIWQFMPTPGLSKK